MTSTLEQVRAQTESEAGVEGQELPLVRGLALRNFGDIERTQGHLQNSLYYFDLALSAILSSPETPDKTREVARTRDRIAEGLFDWERSRRLSRSTTLPSRRGAGLFIVRLPSLRTRPTTV